MSLAGRAKIINAKIPDLVARVTLYASPNNGRKTPVLPGYGCPCFGDRELSKPGWDAWMQLGDTAMELGETRTVGFCFLSRKKAVEDISKSGVFYLWEAGIIGEAIIISV